MVASLLLWSSPMDNTGVGGERENRSFEEQEMMKVESTTVKTRGRKSSKSAQKKQPQRGLGVAQLEKLRMLEKNKKISEFDQVHGHAYDQINNHHHQDHPFQFQFPFLEQQQQNNISVPFSRFGPMNYGATTNINGQLMSSQPFVFHPAYKLGNGGFPGVSGVRPVFSDQFEGDRLRIAHEPRFQNGNPFETAKELSSTQKMHCLFEQCDICLKKKRINGENLGFDVGRTRYTESKPIDGRDFLELDLGRNWNVDGENNKDFGSKGVIRAGYPGVHDEDVEVLAIHRKGKSVRGSILMEYEFFPRAKAGSSNSSSSSLNKEALMAESAKVVAAGVIGETSQSNSNLLDLSLKLSC